MTLHDRIMNISAPIEIEDRGAGERIIYKNGHRDARHVAAEMAIEADELMAEMAEALEQCLYVMERGHCQNTREQASDALNKYKESTK